MAFERLELWKAQNRLLVKWSFGIWLPFSPSLLFPSYDLLVKTRLCLHVAELSVRQTNITNFGEDYHLSNLFSCHRQSIKYQTKTDLRLIWCNWIDHRSWIHSTNRYDAVSSANSAQTLPLDLIEQTKRNWYVQWPTEFKNEFQNVSIESDPKIPTYLNSVSNYKARLAFPQQGGHSWAR